MNKLIVALLIFSLAACNREQPIVEKEYADSLVNQITVGPFRKSIEGDVVFWNNRAVQQPDNTIARSKLVHALINRFHMAFNISDLVKADSIQEQLINYPSAETGQLLTAVSIKMLRHQFYLAANLLARARERNEDRQAVSLLTSDVDFELGNYTDASIVLASNKSAFDYAYNFRTSKVKHYYGKTEEAIAHTLKAAELTSNPYLKSAALSNGADLYLHIGEAEKAYQLYKKCIGLTGNDIHSLTRIGWIALAHDQNLSIAINIFQFLRRITKSPEPLLMMATAYELSDKAKSLAYAKEFENLITQKEFGNMYNKYLVQLYTGILNNPQKAVEVAKRELNNRAIPQTFAWYAWALASAGKKEEALNVYKEKVSGKRLEGIELFWMGKMMAQLNKNYNALLFFREAEKNIYDLTPSMVNELRLHLDD